MRNSARIYIFMLACIVMIGACMISFADDAAGSDITRFFALVIGNGKYPASNMDPLPETATDAAAMKTALENMNPAWTVAEAYNIKGCEFVPAMEEAFRDASEGDVCLFYYTGHGGYDADYYAGALKGTDVNTPGVNYTDALLPLKELADTLDRLCPGEVIVILDSCGSGSAVWNGEPLEGMTTDGTDLELLNSDETTRVGDLRRERFSVLASCEHGDWSYPFPDDDPRTSDVFTYCLLQALGCTPEGAYTGAMRADAHGDRMLTLKETADCARALHEELRNTLPDDFPFQIFQFWGEEDKVLFRR